MKWATLMLIVDCINGEKIPGFSINEIIELIPMLNNQCKYFTLLHITNWGTYIG